MPRALHSGAVGEYYRRAMEARRFAAASRDPDEKADLLEVMEGWLTLAHNYYESQDAPVEVIGQ
jgi:hypothetical protein